LGNMFEAPSENEWGNPFKDDYFEKISNLGFHHVRIPIRWDTPERSLQVEPYTLNPQFLARIKYVVDKALENRLMVIINMHHHETLFTNPDANKEKFLSQWRQISNYFKTYSPNLLFEVLNEPHGQLIPQLWNEYFKDALFQIRKTNPTRAVLLGVADYGGIAGVSKLSIPPDSNLILTIHYYNPFVFTHQGAEWVGEESNKWLGTLWEDTEYERNQIRNEFDLLLKFSKENHLPVHIGEFGAYNKANIDSRIKWTNFLARWFEQQGFSWAYWEFSAGFGIYNPQTNQYEQALVDALLKNNMPSPQKIETKSIFQSRFTESENWFLNVNSPAAAKLFKSESGLLVNVTIPNEKTWYVQLKKGNITLEKGKKYLLSFKMSASFNTKITAYLGNSRSPYNSYCAYPSFNIESTPKEFAILFEMKDPNDSQASLNLDLASNIAEISLYWLKIEEIIDPNLLPNENISLFRIFPNPSNGYIQWHSTQRVDKIEVFNQNGLIIKSLDTSLQVNNIDLCSVTDGIYYLVLYINGEKFIRKILKFNPN